MLASLIAALARFIFGGVVIWTCGPPDQRQRVYFANHTTNLDFVLLWTYLPPGVRRLTRPIAAKDYWDGKWLRRFMAANVFRAVLIQRGGDAYAADGTPPSDDAGAAPDRSAHGRQAVGQMIDALGDSNSLIIFPEGRRNPGPEVGTFRSGLFHLCSQRPDLEIVPVYIENLSRALPKGEVLPVPTFVRLTFGEPTHLMQGESKDEFLARTREAVQTLANLEADDA